MNTTTEVDEVLVPQVPLPRKKLKIISVQDALAGNYPPADLTKVVGAIPMSDEEYDAIQAWLRDHP
jgi:hypothetical protein